MSKIDVCPEVSAYRELMRGRSLPDCEALLAHLKGCQQCRRTVQALDDWLLNASLGGAPESEARQRAREIVRRSSPQPTLGALTAGACADESLALPPGFLSPAQLPSEMGRLGGYRVLRMLGRGGMGIVFEAEDANLRRKVALKVMKPELAASPRLRERFLREARTAASVESDYVCPIYQVGEDNGVPFIAMPLLKGAPLDYRLQREKRLPLAAVVRIGREIALGLAAAHQKGLVHRDVKPANVWLEMTPNGPARARLLDFGLARGESDGHLTRTGEVIGTPAYFSPEQARGQRVDARSDLFSLGVILYEMATGERPFTGSDPVSVLSSLALDTPEPPASRRPDLPAALSGLIMSLLEKDPQSRPVDAAEVATRLAQCQPASRPAAPAPAAPDASRDQLLRMETQISPILRGPRPNWGGLVWAAVLGLVLALGGGLAAYVLIFETRDGSLVVEVDGDAEVRFAKGELRLYDENGELKYTLKPSQKNKSLPQGRYRVAVQGADGLRLDTETFELEKKGKVVVRVSAAPVVSGNDAADGEDRARADKGKERAKWQAEERMKEGAYRAAMNKAEAAMKAEKYDEARQAYAEALKQKPKDADALRGGEGAANLLARQQREAEAQQSFRDGMDALLGLAGRVDEERALGLFRQAAARGSPVAAAWVGRLTFLGKGAPKDEAEGARLVSEALPPVRRKAEDGDADAQAVLGALLAGGLGVEKDEKEAAHWYSRAADRGSVFAMSRLGWAYANGRGVDKDERKAVEWLQKAADRGDATATLELGRAYADGRGVDKDEKKAVELFRRAADKSHAGAMSRLGLTYSNGQGVERDDRRAFDLFQKAADKGDVSAMANLGWSYENGRGVDRDEKKAAVWYRKAADKGNAYAMNNLGRLFATGRGVDRDEKKATDLYREAADKGYAPAMGNLGWCYEVGRGVGKDEKEAVLWYQKAAETGDPLALSNLGQMYADGRGVDKDEKKAAELFRRAAEKGNPVAMTRLGTMYGDGRGVGKDEKEAAEWFQKAADRGYAPAMSILGWLYEQGRGVDRDEKKAVEWYQKAADSGDATGTNNLGWMFESGRGVDRDEKKAVELYEKAADKGNPYGMYNLGRVYAAGRGVERDEKKAVEWYRKSADLGHAFAAFALGWSYETGRGVEKDAAKALEWYKKAAALGHEGAKQKVKELEGTSARSSPATPSPGPPRATRRLLFAFG